jgi:hypothetical protein
MLAVRSNLTYDFHMSLLRSVFLVTTLLIVGAVLWEILKSIKSKYTSKLLSRAPIIRKYWKFVTPFIVLTAIAYVLTYIYAYSDANINLVGQVSTLILAIFAGYIAFAELGESRFDNLVNDGSEAARAREIRRAEAKYKEANSIKPDDVRVLGNLLELNIVLGNFDEFDTKITHFKRISLEESDELAHFYLLALRHLIKEYLGEARTSIEDSIKFVNDHPGCRDKFHWTNDEVIQSDAFLKLTSQTKKLIVNHFAYLKGQLSPEEEGIFVSGDYDSNTAISNQIVALPEIENSELTSEVTRKPS